MSESTKKPEQEEQAEQAEEKNPAETSPAQDDKKTEKKASKVSKKDRISELEKELEEAQKSLKESGENFLRLAAEYDNFRKRSIREKDDIKIRSKTDVVEKLLPVIDNFERAAMNAEADADSYRKGIEMIYRQFGDILTALGIEAFGEEGDAFDPNIHSAVMHVEDENVGENVIVKVFTKGYKLDDTVIRPAVVQVAN
ncbi:MAG: nucleotide exchange factor GrpE [Acutalibacteraceae bacterium]